MAHLRGRPTQLRIYGFLFVHKREPLLCNFHLPGLHHVNNDIGDSNLEIHYSHFLEYQNHPDPIKIRFSVCFRRAILMCHVHFFDFVEWIISEN